MDREEKEINTHIEEKEELPSNHFSQVDLEEQWFSFLLDLEKSKRVEFNAVSTCRLFKSDENEVTVKLPSETVKSEFKRIEKEFFGRFMHKVNNHRIEIKYKLENNLRIKIPNKRKIFDKFAIENPVLRDLDDLMEFHFD